MWKIALVVAATPVVAFAGVFIALRAIDWARKNRARAAAMMAGNYLEQVTGGHIAGECDSIWDTFTTWLGEKVDAVSESSGDPPEGSGGGGHDSGGHHGGHCDGGGVCE